ncbi:hypothetical protein ACUN0C_03645 [Faunimonas sp. B44]|uniref:hypothetical protein n=1 Tax=Faunimonas sp. B44 TaxID=3461493 RepID=UPI004044C998
MGPVRNLAEVFKTVGLPPYTYVKPPYFGEVRADIEQAGKHVLIEGPSGIGKTCVVYKVFEEIGWSKDKTYTLVSGRDENAKDIIDEFLQNSKDSGSEDRPKILVIDDFHILDDRLRVKYGEELKRMSDRAFEDEFPPKVILIGIPTAGASLLATAQDLGPRLGAYRFKRATDDEIRRLVDEGEQELNVIFEDSEIVLAESAGNFWLAQYVCNKICSMNGIFQTCVDTCIIRSDVLEIRQRLMDELSNRFMPVAKMFAKGKKWRPGGNKPYLEILLSIAKLHDLVIPFDTILSNVPDRRKPGIKAVRARINEVIYDPERNVDLRKQLAFEDAGFSIEDPLFRYFLTFMKKDDLYRELGVTSDSAERSSVYKFDVGFSFSGEVRSIVELINCELKDEDVVTFYDFDQQAVLLAENLEGTLKRVYSESCRYYLVFLESSYLDRIWTNYERDIRTAGGRSKHIIPVFLEPRAETKVVGIPTVTGSVDLTDIWREVKSGGITDEVRTAIRNRLVIPLLEKIDAIVKVDP